MKILIIENKKQDIGNFDYPGFIILEDEKYIKEGQCPELLNFGYAHETEDGRLYDINGFIEYDEKICVNSDDFRIMKDICSEIEYANRLLLFNYSRISMKNLIENKF